MEMKFGPRRLVRKLTYANVVATLALMIAISGGTALAASHLITGKQIARGTISATNIKKHTLTSSLFKKGTIRRGATGATGATGPAGPTGPAGTSAVSAYGTITTNGSGNPQFESGVTAGFSSVYAPSTGYLCIPAPAGLVGGDPLAVSEAGGVANQNWEQVANGQCGGSGFELANTYGTSLSGQITILAP